MKNASVWSTILHRLLRHTNSRRNRHIHRLNGHFPDKHGLASCPLDNLIRVFGAKFYRPDVLPVANQQIHTGRHLFCIHYKANQSNHVLNSGSHEAKLLTSKLHGYTNYETLDMQIKNLTKDYIHSCAWKSVKACIIKHFFGICLCTLTTGDLLFDLQSQVDW